MMEGRRSSKHHRNWRFWRAFMWPKLSVMFLNSISPLKYLVVAVNGQRTLSQHCGEKQVSEAGRKALSPRYVSCNRHNPGNLTLKTGRRAEKEGRQVGGWQQGQERRWGLTIKPTRDLNRSHMQVHTLPWDAVTIPALDRCGLKIWRTGHQNPEPGEDLLIINCYSVTAAPRGRRDRGSEIHPVETRTSIQRPTLKFEWTLLL